MKAQIVLPERMYILKDYDQLGIQNAAEEFNIYFKNIILPYKTDWDIIVECEYGKNHGSFWRITEFPREKDSFPLKIKVYDEYGEKLAENSTTVVMNTIKRNPEKMRLICIGDSMTQSQGYVEQVAKKLNNIEFIGTRSFNNIIFHEGRGGWAWDGYFNRSYPRFGVSPFLFPENVEGKDYFGCVEFYEEISKFPRDDYPYAGFKYEEIKDGQYFTKERILYKRENNSDILIDKEPKFEFSFKKYVERYNLGKVDAVSILMGGNDLQLCTYEEINERVKEFTENTAFVIKKIKENDPTTKIIINTPVIGAEQYCWGNSPMRCNSSSKIYRMLAIKSTQSFIDNFEKEENVYISPMICNLDPEYGFDTSFYKANRYSEVNVQHQNNWVHPNAAGYKQMGDSLAATIEHIRKEF